MKLSLGKPNGKILSRDIYSGGSADQGSQVARKLQYGVRGGREASEVGAGTLSGYGKLQFLLQFAGGG